MHTLKTFFLILITVAWNAHLHAQTISNTEKDSLESRFLKSKVGKWTVKMILKPAMDSKPITQTFSARRTMIGPFCLHEIMQPSPGSDIPEFTRVCDMAYNKNENNWHYSSIDTRITGGIMFFVNFGDDKDSISTHLLSFSHPGLGPQQEGRGKAVRSRTVIVRKNKDADIVKQYWKLTDQPEWLAVQYEYTRSK
jgi:hypothetical protein